MDSSRYYQLVYGLVLISLTVCTCTFVYVLTRTVPVLNASKDASSGVASRGDDVSDASAWELRDVVEPIRPVKIPDPLEPEDVLSVTDVEGKRFIVRHPAFEGMARLPIFEVILGAPGMYPPLTTRTNQQGEFSLNIDELYMLNGETVDSVELMIRPLNKELQPSFGYWSQVELSTLDEIACTSDVYRCSAIDVFDVVPMGVQVRSVDGELLGHANVRLSRDYVGLVHLKDEWIETRDGTLLFGGMAQGSYVLTVSAKGYLSEQINIVHEQLEVVSQDSDLEDETIVHQVVLEEGKSIGGRVVDSRGQGVAGAFITVYVDRYGEPEVLPVETFSNINSIPARGIAMTSEDGYFSVSGLPRGVAYVTAMSTFGMPSLSSPVDLRNVREATGVNLALNEGEDVEVLVLAPEDEGGGAVSGVQVYWRDGASGLRGESISNYDGLAWFEEVPSGAEFYAEFEGWSALPQGLDSPDEDGVYRLSVKLEPPGLRQDLALKVFPPPRTTVSVERITFHEQDSDSVCQTNQRNALDWTLRSCRVNRAGQLEIFTREHGVVLEDVTLEHANIVHLSAPTPVEVLLKGWPTPPEAITLQPLSFSTQWQAPLDVFDRRGSHRVYRGDLYPGAYRLKVIDNQGEVQERTVHVGDTPFSMEWLPVSRHMLRVDVVDSREHRLHEGFFAVLDAGKKTSDVRQHNSAHYVPLTSEDIGKKTLLACGANTGCVTHVIDEADLEQDSIVLRTSGEPLTGMRGVGALTRVSDIEALLGGQLVRDNYRLLVDVKCEDCLAAKLGIARGSSLLYVGELPLEAGKRQVQAVVQLPDNKTWRFLSYMIEPE